MKDNAPIRAAFFYAVFGLSWILVSDSLLLWLSDSPAVVARAQTIKGWAFVLITTALVYFLTRRYTRQKHDAYESSERSNKLLSQALEEKELLVRELHHRVKNNLQLVLALLNMSDSCRADEALQRRIFAIAASHELSLGTKQVSEISLGAFVSDLVAQELRPRCPHELDVHVESTAVLPLQISITCGLLLSELVSLACNAMGNGASGAIGISVSDGSMGGRVTLSHPAVDRLAEAAPEGMWDLCQMLALQCGGSIRTEHCLTEISVIHGAV